MLIMRIGASAALVKAMNGAQGSRFDAGTSTQPVRAVAWRSLGGLGAVVLTLLIGVSRPEQEIPADPPSLQVLITAASQDRAVFLTWTPVPGAKHFQLWRPVNRQQWSALESGDASHGTVTGLSNGVPYDFKIIAVRNGVAIAGSSIATSTPRERPGCQAIEYIPWEPRVSFFCTKTAFDAYLTRKKINRSTLKCRGRPSGDDWPDCLYTTPEGERLLLLRSADATFGHRNGFPDVDVIRRRAREAIWPNRDPFAQRETASWTKLSTPDTGNVTRHRSAQSFRIELGAGLSSRITWFSPLEARGQRYAIYQEGHGGAGTQIGAQTIDWFLDRGWYVVVLDMPLMGWNTADARIGLRSHWDFDSLDRGLVSPVELFALPVKSVVDRIAEQNGPGDPELLLIGRSGGGWTAYVYGALDPRIDIVVSVAGGRPLSERLSAPWGALELGDYEQSAPHLYNGISHEDLMIAAGARGALYIYNRLDPCCFRIAADSEFVQYLRGAASAAHKQIDVYVDEQNPDHSIGARGYDALDRYLGQVAAAPASIALTGAPRKP